MIHLLVAVVRAGAKAVRQGASSGAQRAEQELLEALRNRDQKAFAQLVRKHAASMLRVARGVLGDEASAQEVVQETWETVVKEIGNFRAEASLSTWIFRILINRARRVGKREARSTPFSALLRKDAEEENRDLLDEFTWYGRWRSPVHGWKQLDPQTEAITGQGLQTVAAELEKLPETQRAVVTMRDVEGLDSDEVCELLQISSANQRVLLHRGRTQLRRALEAAEST